MPIERDLDQAKKALYEDKEYLQVVSLCDGILKESNENIMALIYKSTGLEKLYFSTVDWHNPDTLESSRDLLTKALNIATHRGDRGKIGLIHFRFFVHYFNLKKYEEAKKNMDSCKEFGYTDDTLFMWEMNLEKKLKKIQSKLNQSPKEPDILKKTCKAEVSPLEETAGVPETDEIKYRVDWYQTNKSINISIFTKSLPQTKEDIKISYDNNSRNMEITYPVNESKLTFKKTMTLTHPIEPDSIAYELTARKIEVIISKEDKTINWKTLEATSNVETTTRGHNYTSADSNTDSASKNRNPSASKIDWSKIDLGSDEDDDGIDNSSADAFFQKLYANADPDTKRAMMKSFVESNGTALNTNWDDVKQGKVETSPPEGMELKNF
ncbi:hypothetical protein TPHA_0L02110 [Tetrapisispora phaffii CBS 4417]|uniref:CS domain-containing protein n=1 Tax=Tetrapisispora phaffii (strain ATCC 24235 / CBS 4417 / NBRC 1672 / NRRL Y-8282 / UCD 70-5) TaxID=1071381 RepID=G8C084_TETPH|nr:hypothetical protein TPHA_0L02110 [Tetrapisispora phaffii CBS 4417]CCE65562.1 hypothetical protein TPHA_0L02110 [Tetrapisispora phaffii CBS 4417]